MSLTRRFLTLASLGVVASATPSFAGWNNVFLTSCNDCEPRTSYKLPPTSTSMKLESTSYYETVTVMRPEKFIEEVPVKVTSYFYEPVTTYTYRSYYDSCSRQCQQIAVPRTSKVRREECNTVMKAVERVRMVPVQVEREVTESRPVYTSYGPVQKHVGPYRDSASAPRVDEYRNSKPSIQQEGGSIPETRLPTLPMNMPGGVSNPKAKPSAPANFRSNAMTTSFAKAAPTKVYGEVVQTDQKTPLANAKLVFVNVADVEKREYISADAYGQFEKTLPAGEWYLYVGPGDGKANLHSQIKVSEGEPKGFNVVASK
jgi:hypothetical protein